MHRVMGEGVEGGRAWRYMHATEGVIGSLLHVYTVVGCRASQRQALSPRYISLQGRIHKCYCH